MAEGNGFEGISRPLFALGQHGVVLRLEAKAALGTDGPSTVNKLAPRTLNHDFTMLFKFKYRMLPVEPADRFVNSWRESKGSRHWLALWDCYRAGAGVRDSRADSDRSSIDDHIGGCRIGVALKDDGTGKLS